MFSLKRWQNITWTFCVNHTRRVEQYYLENKKNDQLRKQEELKQVWHSTQHNYENGLSMTQNELVK